MKTPRPLNFFSTENLATAFHPAWTVLGPSLSRGGHRLHCSGRGSAAPAHAAAVASGFFPALVHPSPHLSEHRWCFREEPAETLRSFTQTAIESPALCVNARVIFLPCVAYCFILLHFTLPTPSPTITHLPAQLWPPGTMLAGDTGGHRVQRRCGGNAEASRADVPPPPMEGCHINSFPAETLAADAVLWDAVIRALPARSELPVLPHPLGCPLLSSSPGLCQAMSPGAFCFSQRGRFAARCRHSGADPYHAAALGRERRAAA